jgi:hypothetical protein
LSLRVKPCPIDLTEGGATHSGDALGVSPFERKNSAAISVECFPSDISDQSHSESKVPSSRKKYYGSSKGMKPLKGLKISMQKLYDDLDN